MDVKALFVLQLLFLWFVSLCALGISAAALIVNLQTRDPPVSHPKALTTEKVPPISPAKPSSQ
jgi:hypothetical protein